MFIFRNILRASLGPLAAVFIGLGGAALAASEFEGTWNVKDTEGKPFSIILGADGSAKGTREEGMTGTWKEEAGKAVITWDTGWTTVISKGADGYTKSAYEKGKPLEGPPTNTSDAEKAGP